MPSQTRLLVPSPRELIIVTRPEAKIRVKDGTVISESNFDVTSINELLKHEELLLRPLFGLSEKRLRAQARLIEIETGQRPPDLSVFERLYGPDHLLEELAERFMQEEFVEAAYVKPGVRPGIWFTDMEPNTTQSPDAPPLNFEARQGYLNPANDGGIDARFAWTQPGGRGCGISIMDVEGAWCFDHDDLKTNQGGLVAGQAILNDVWRNHGTAVIGIFSGDKNKRGITGICHEANVSSASIFEIPEIKGWGSAAAINAAANKLKAGDILLLEVQRAGPRVDFKEQQNQFGDIPVEWWPCDFDAIKMATTRGVLVVSAGGNGQQDLGDPFYDSSPVTSGEFPADWQNPFHRGLRDSGSIIVGAGGPRVPGLTQTPDLCRTKFSNFDESNEVSIFDAQGWGESVTTCGFGNLEEGGGEDENFWYTDNFSGTSSAAPMIAGALGCLQGIRLAQNQPPLTPAQARELLRTTGRPQQDHPNSPASKRIGNRPDLKELIESLPA